MEQRVYHYVRFGGCDIRHSYAALANDLQREELGLIRHYSNPVECIQLALGARSSPLE